MDGMRGCICSAVIPWLDSPDEMRGCICPAVFAYPFSPFIEIDPNPVAGQQGRIGRERGSWMAGPAPPTRIAAVSRVSKSCK